MFGLWFLNSEMNFSYLTSRLCASIVGIMVFLPLKEMAHMWTSHFFSGVKFRWRSYRLSDFFDPLGAIFMLLFGYGWAKKFPYFVSEPDSKSEYVLVYLSGVIFNFFSAVLIGILLNLLIMFGIYSRLNLNWIKYFLNNLIEINVILAVVNILPFPSLDGFKICEAFIPEKYLYVFKQNYLFISIILSIILFSGVINTPLDIFEQAVYKTVRIISSLPFLIFKH